MEPRARRTADGGRLAWASASEVVRVAEVATLGVAPASLSLRGPIGHASPLAFSPDGRALAARSDDGVVLWSSRGAPLAIVSASGAVEGGYAMGPGFAPLVEILGPEVELAADLPVCRSGALVLPFEVCRERFEKQGLLAAALRGEAMPDPP